MNLTDHRFDPAAWLTRGSRTRSLTLAVVALLALCVLLPLLFGALIGFLLLLLLLAGLGWLGANRPALDGYLLVEPAFGGSRPERVVLTGRSVALRPQVGGAGRVYGRRRLTGGRLRLSVRIRYSPDGSAARASAATCAPGSRVVVGGTAFSYHGPSAGAAPSGGLR
ncbi:hypothetical protein OG455_32170 [Kitasatospora sp. NBC_01287]|uniref:hypothetical protein n=1 Tax=Kitasatospora sp. NBC_01287 TaxID=2903573 RepID=UPI002250C1F9|nr:hypothetical protein [Kitasatospora sp. NBC_01287]MCX4750119.1 hypothetical protein [Kitasatospora sp. NBC_01287]